MAILCMPEFRNCYLRTLDRPGPPSVVALGADDGGLFALLDERVPWFHSWLIPVLHSRGERYAFGNVMVVLNREERDNFMRSLATVKEHCARARYDPALCFQTVVRFSDLLQRVEGDESLDLVLCERGP